jgi:hypothetical protein
MPKPPSGAETRKMRVSHDFCAHGAHPTPPKCAPCAGESCTESGTRPLGQSVGARKHKLAAHLTFARIQYQEKELVPSKDITAYLLGLSCLFVDELPPRRQVWFGGLQL